MTRFRILLLLSLGAGCQAGGSGGPEEAEWALRAEAARNPGDAALQARWKEARTKAAADSFAKIEAALKSGDLPAAERRSEVAVFYVPENAEYRRRFGEVRALRRDVREQIRQADEAMRRRDWVRARRILEPIGTYQASFPQIGQMWPIVAKENFGIALREGERFMKVQDYEESRAWYEDALKLFPDDADARAKWKTADNRARARVLAHEAEELVAAGRLEDGVAKAWRGRSRFRRRGCAPRSRRGTGSPPAKSRRSSWRRA
ncbi:MAG: hypothetical protein HY293_13730 [Planctomycetes bacterium]|nr:hypothetical protein [Planctomycetota bacterium]